MIGWLRHEVLNQLLGILDSLSFISADFGSTCKLCDVIGRLEHDVLNQLLEDTRQSYLVFQLTLAVQLINAVT